MRTQEYNPVLLFDPQGIEQGEGMDNLDEDDFVLALQLSSKGM